jgi:MFS family permease
LAAGYFIFSLALSIIAPFFPPFAEDKGISEDLVGLIYSANPIGAVVAAVILGKIVNDVEKILIV